MTSVVQLGASYLESPHPPTRGDDAGVTSLANAADGLDSITALTENTCS